ncbi:MAG: anti-sigma factor antagonist [Oscillospiraceae bacterium]|nr:anti-sigma factor antagonist [Oscillospiraceae bacterium]
MNEQSGGNCAVIALSGKIDSGNAAQTEQQIMDQLAGKQPSEVVLNADALEYISSAGLRVILRLKQKYPEVRIINARPEVYEILEITGFTEMMPVGKAYRVVSVEGCKLIGEGYSGRVYRIDRETVVKVYKNAVDPEEIRQGQEISRLALVLGLPTAISYDVVRVGDSYGSVFELLNARSFAEVLAEEPERLDWCVKEYVGLLKKVHSIVAPKGKLPSIKKCAVEKAESIKDDLPDGLGEKLLHMICRIPESDHLTHGDYHTKNIVLSGDEVLLIDMDNLSTGHPIFELAQMYKSFVGFSEYNPEIVHEFQGYPADIAREFWKRSRDSYLAPLSELEIEEIEEKVRCVAYAELIEWKKRSGSLDSEEDRATMKLWRDNLVSLLRKHDSLLIDLPALEAE